MWFPLILGGILFLLMEHPLVFGLVLVPLGIKLIIEVISLFRD